jgi:hypothetical protein
MMIVGHDLWGRMRRAKPKLIWCQIAIVMIGLGAVSLLNHLLSQLGVAFVCVGVVMVTAPLVWRFFRYFWRLGEEIGLELRVASTPLPSPAEICWTAATSCTVGERPQSVWS